MQLSALAPLFLMLLIPGLFARGILASSGPTPFERWLGSYSILSCRCTDNGKLSPLDCHLGGLAIEGDPGEEHALRENGLEEIPIREYQAPKGSEAGARQWIEETEAQSTLRQRTVLEGPSGFEELREYQLTRFQGALTYRRYIRVKGPRGTRAWECAYSIERKP